MGWIRGPTIGHGSSAVVSIATFDDLGETLAVKSVDLCRSEPLQHEQRILSSLNCPHIVTYKGYDITRESSNLVYNLFLEYLPRGTLTDEIRKQGGKLDEATIARYSRQIVRAADYLHSRGLVHCDIKGRNILIGDDGAKIADFGCAKSAVDAGSCRGTPAYMAPEVARGEGQGMAADVWAFGCTVVEMATGKSPWADEAGDPVSVLYRIGFSDGSPDIPGSLSGQAKDFLEKCLRRSPEDRWTTSQLLDHPFLVDRACSGPVWSSDSVFDSPTSILDLGIWSSDETELEITRNFSNEFTQSRGVEGLEAELDRIAQLAGPSGWAPNWGRYDECWVAVRGDFGGGDRDRDNVEHRNVGSAEEMGIDCVGKNTKLDRLGESGLSWRRTTATTGEEDLLVGFSVYPVTAVNVSLDFERYRMDSIP